MFHYERSLKFTLCSHSLICHRQEFVEILCIHLDYVRDTSLRGTFKSLKNWFKHEGFRAHIQAW